MLEVKKLKKIYKSKMGEYVALKDISLKVNKGEFVAVMGPSGSGKTTLLNCISGFIHADGGEILLDNSNILNIDEDTLAEVRQNKLGFVFQDFMLVNGLTVLENVNLPQIIAGKDINEMDTKTAKLLDAFGIDGIKIKYPNDISGGQKQRVAVARALSNEPLVLLADEPTGNLDSKSSISVIEAFTDEDSIEEIKSGNILLGILGVIIIPVGIAIYGLASRADSFLGNISIIFAILPLIGIYLVAVQVANIGDFVKKFSIKKYNKNIMFFNMLKLKGKQYSQTIIVTTILTAVIIFALCFSIGNFVAGQKIVKEYPVDFLLKYREDLDIVSEEKIRELSDKYNVNISDYEEFEAIMLIGDGITYDEELDKDVYEEFAYDMYCISEETYNNLTGENVDVKEGSYYTIFDEFPKEVDETPIKLTNIFTLYQKQYEDQGILVNKGINISGIYLLVLDNSDYNREYSSLNDIYKDVYIRFNVDNWEESYDFAKELRTFIVNNSIDDVAVESGAAPFTEEFTGKEPAFEKLTLDPESAELYRWWKYNPKFKILDYNDTVVQYAVYVLLFVFIALLGFISVSMIFYVKSISSVWDDKKIYQNISFLGAKNKYIKACITKVIAVLFTLPTVLGAISAYSLILLIIGELKGQVLYKLVCENSLIIVIIFSFIQLIAFLITRKIVSKKILDFDTI